MRRLFNIALLLIMPVAALGDTQGHVTPPAVTDDVVWVGVDRFDVPYAVTSRSALLIRDQKGWVTVNRADFIPPRGASLAELWDAAARYVNSLVVRPRMLATASNTGLSLGPLRGLTKKGSIVALLPNVGSGSARAGSYLATSDDGGRLWTRARSNTTAELRAIAVGAEDVVYAVGARGSVLRSIDGGRNWRHVAAEWNAPPPDGLPIPAPWFVIWNLFVTVPLLAVATRSLPRDEKTIETDSVAEMLGSDRPLEKGDPDAMNLRSIAVAISRFLRNESTLPPLTVAVTGEWGSGKSSLMNLLRADLIDFGFRPVWFNAWHHQKEEHLLASLLQAVREQAVPRWWRPENFFFRLRLIWIRGWKYRANLLLLILFLSLAIGFETRHHGGHPFATIDDAVQTISQNDVKGVVKKLPGAGNEFVALMTLVTILATAWRGAKAFHVNPATLLTTLAGSAKVNDLSAGISFRDKFAAEFNDVTKALGERSLLIFIDDLDRCSPGSVGEVLEAVNFLVSSGDCFVVMGMDRTRVERYVNVNFTAVAGTEEGFARKYLDKLINIEVPVPEPNDDASTQILVPVRADGEIQSSWQLLWQAGVASLRFWPVALAVVIAVAGFLSMTITPRPTAVQSSVLAGSGAARSVPAIASTNNGVGLTVNVQPNMKQPGDVIRGESVSQWATAWPAPLFWIALAGVGAWLLRRPQDIVVHDSPQFLSAIRIWHRVIARKLRTPRALKRFMNRLRYLAMRQRPQEEVVTFARQLRLWALRKKREAPLPMTNAIPEAALVALASIELYEAAEVPLLSGIVDEHRREFGHSPADWADAFHNTAAGVHAN